MLPLIHKPSGSVQDKTLKSMQEKEPVREASQSGAWAIGVEGAVASLAGLSGQWPRVSITPRPGATKGQLQLRARCYLPIPTLW